MSTAKRELDAARRETISGDDEFAASVRAAIPAFTGAKLRKAAHTGATANLIAWLVSDKPLGRGDRVFLAELLAGELHVTGRPAKTLLQNQEDRALAKDALARREELIANGSKAVDAEGEAAEWFAQNDPRARGRAEGTIVRLMQEAHATYRRMKPRKLLRQ